ncbi:hypothetical protein pEaSNUABM42_00131 [Erwinia phage pEa_SNUABM_42]|nr:hypothetical protein pEaSNUABM43_00131 [Erwinia phage pEa_SNUABM_43]QVW55448.1 hypothetical protein pEaSNUABM42_00131 [Erwinia phage pEa_SNUABM_42]
MHMLIVSIVAIFLILNLLGVGIGKLSVRYNWSFWAMLTVALFFGGLIGNVYFSYIIRPLYQNLGS